MNDPVTIRAKVREVLAMSPRREFTRQMIFDGVKRLVPEPLTVNELAAGIEWNIERNFVQFRRDDDLDCDVWSLTKNGKAKEGVK